MCSPGRQDLFKLHSILPMSLISPLYSRISGVFYHPTFSNVPFFICYSSSSLVITFYNLILRIKFCIFCWCLISTRPLVNWGQDQILCYLCIFLSNKILLICLFHTHGYSLSLSLCHSPPHIHTHVHTQMQTHKHKLTKDFGILHSLVIQTSNQKFH